MIKKNYLSPEVEVITVNIEKGFATSGIGDGTEQMEEIEGEWE